jgi:hypothetical protein
VQGRRLTETDTRDDDADGTIDERATNAFTYDASGNVVDELATQDEDGDGTPEDIRRTTYEYVAVDAVGAILNGIGYGVMVL